MCWGGVVHVLADVPFGFCCCFVLVVHPSILSNVGNVSTRAPSSALQNRDVACLSIRRRSRCGSMLCFRVVGVMRILLVVSRVFPGFGFTVLIWCLVCSTGAYGIGLALSHSPTIPLSRKRLALVLMLFVPHPVYFPPRVPRVPPWGIRCAVDLP